MTMKDDPYKDRIEMAHRAFDFLIIATPEEIEEIGWRLGEKLDGSDADDLISRYLAPLLAGLEKGSSQKIKFASGTFIEKKPNDWESDIYLPEFLSRLLTQVKYPI